MLAYHSASHLFLNSALWSLPSAAATSILRPVWADPHVIDPSVELGSLITVISLSRSAAGVREPYYQDLVSFLPHTAKRLNAARQCVL